MLNIKRFFSFLGLVAMLPVLGIHTASAQTSLDEWAVDSLWFNRIGTGRDSIDCQARYFDLWNKYITPHNRLAKSLEEAGKDRSLADSLYNDSTYYLWRRVMNQAPYVHYYFYTEGWVKDFLVHMMKTTADKSIQLMYFQDMMSIENALVNNRDTLNALRRGYRLMHNNQSLADAEVKRAHYYYSVGKELFGNTKIYSKEQAYDYFKKAFETVRADNSNSASEVEGIYLGEYFNASYDLFKTDEEKYYDQFLTDYIDIIATCDHFLLQYADVPDEVKNNTSDPRYRQYQSYNYYTNASIAKGNEDDGVVALFDKSGVGTPERLNEYYGPRLAEHRNDADYLNTAIHLMYSNGSTNNDAFYNYCKASYELKPTYENCVGCALSSARDSMLQDEIKYYKEALSLASTDLEKGMIAYIAADAQCKAAPSVDGKINTNSAEYKNWLNNEGSTIISAYKSVAGKYSDAMSKSSSMAVREYPAIAAYRVGQYEYRMAKLVSECDDAKKWVQKSINMKPTLSLLTEDRLSYIKNIEKKREQIAHNDKAILANKAWAAQKAAQDKAYQEQQRRKAAESAFWGY